MAEFTEEQYFNLADRVYNNDVLKKGKSFTLADRSQWRVINYVDKSGSGLQAVAVVPAKDYKKGKTDYNNVVFVSRGSEPNAGQFVKDWIQTDFGKMGIGLKPSKDAKLKETQGKNVQKLAKNAWKVNAPIPLKVLLHTASWQINSDNQFTEYQNFVNQTLKQYKVKDYSFTGHSLGGALAQFMAVQLKKRAVTYAAANPFRLLSKEQQASIRNGDFKDLITDYRHRLDPVGKIVPNGVTIGKQFIMDTNPNAKFGTAVFMGHMRGTFAGMFNADGTAKLKVNPDAVIAQAGRIDNIVSIMRKIQQHMQQLEEDVNQKSKKLREKLNDETVEGGKYSELTIWDVDEILTERSKKYQNGIYTFHDPEQFQRFYESNEKNIKKLKEFQKELIQAAKKIREKDNELGDWIAANMK
ncbi:lipase family protein [Listeria valentina]|uniref:lipase family protein n=1 Tax=Listeria valentina TaxID=2705293 RepID=UPI001431C2F6|nr:lipase [Listeria valentina]